MICIRVCIVTRVGTTRAAAIADFRKFELTILNQLAEYAELQLSVCPSRCRTTGGRVPLLPFASIGATSQTPPYLIAEFYADLRDKDQAFLRLDTAYQERDLSLLTLKTDWPTAYSTRCVPTHVLLSWCES